MGEQQSSATGRPGWANHAVELRVAKSVFFRTNVSNRFCAGQKRLVGYERGLSMDEPGSIRALLPVARLNAPFPDSPTRNLL